MPFGRGVCQFANQLRNTCHGRLVNGTVLALIDGHDCHHNLIIVSDGIDVNFNGLRTLVHAREHGAMKVLV